MLCNGHTLCIAIASNQTAIAVIDEERSYDYAELGELAMRVVSGFDELGLTPNDRLMVVMQNSMDMIVLYWACQLSGVVFTPINWRVTGSELDYFLIDSAAVALVFDSSATQAVTEAKQLQHIQKICTAPSIDDEVVSMSALQQSPVIDIECRAAPDDMSILLYTSGTTGPGKGVPRSHRAERAAAIAHVAQNAYLSGESTLGVMPMYHTMGIRLVLSMAIVCGRFVSARRFSPVDAVQLIEQHNVSSLYLVPTLFHDLLSDGNIDSSKIASVSKLGFAGAPMTQDLLQKLNATFNPDMFVNHYGSTEIYTFTIEQQAVVKPGSAGKAGINATVRVIPVDSDDPNAIAPVGLEGQIIVALNSDEAFQGYWRRPDADECAIKDGWYFTGDIGHLDDDGDLFVIGRVDDMIISGGENVLPVEIESLLSLHPSVEEVAVVGLPDTRWGQAVTAFIRQSTMQSTTDIELDQWCRSSELADFKRPKKYHFVTAIPKSPVGKILRRELLAGHYKLDRTVADFIEIGA